MRTQEINFVELLRSVLPVDKLSPELRRRVHEVLAGTEPETAEEVATAVLRELEGRGLVRSTDLGERRRRYQDLRTGAVITIQLPAAAAGAIAMIPLPLAPGSTPASLETTRELLLLASQILSADGSRVAEKEQLIPLLLSFTRQVLACDDVRFLTLERDGEGFLPIAGSDSLFAGALKDEWGPARRHILLIRELNPATAGGSDWRTAAAIRLGRPGDPVRGVIEVYSARPGHFTRERLALLELIAETGRELLTNIARLQELVFIDSRTQIFNKAFFEIQFANLLARARREGRQLALALIDVDDFKAFNTRYGYAGGDQVLYRVAQILKGQVRPFDCVARWGGEEFTVVLAPPVEPDDARAICDRLRRAVQQTTILIPGLDAKEHRTSVTVSVGGVLYPDDGGTAEELWRRANEALLTAKNQGKNRVHFRPHERRDLRVAPA